MISAIEQYYSPVFPLGGGTVWTIEPGVLAASSVANTAAGGISATNVQDAINELDTEKLSTAAAATTYQTIADAKLRFVQGARTTVTTNGSGAATITFPVAYASTPAVVANNGDATVGSSSSFTIATYGPSTTNFSVAVRDAAGAPVPSYGLTIAWIAIGARS